MAIEVQRFAANTVNVKEIRLHIKTCDMFEGTLVDDQGREVGEYGGYVPSFFPGNHYGDYLILNIDLETGQITNWEAPDGGDIGKAFFSERD